MQLSGQRLFRFSAGQKYHQTIRGKNCNVEEIVVTEAECKVALDSLGLSWLFENRWTNRPAGCWQSGGYGYFNLITDPLVTHPPYKDNATYGGVCKVKGISFSCIH